jgi:hypothetical protein
MAFTAGSDGLSTGWILLLKEVVPEEIDYKATPLIIRSSFTAEHPHSWKIIYMG